MAAKRDTSRNGRSAWLSPEQQRAWVAFMRVQLRMDYEMNRQLQADAGLSLSDYHVLVALSGAGEDGMRVGDLAAHIGWERSRVSHQLRRMEQRGLTRRETGTEDARTTNVVLTAQGRAAIEQAAPAHVDLVRRLFFDALPAPLLAPFTTALEHIHVNLNLNSSLPPTPH